MNRSQSSGTNQEQIQSIRQYLQKPDAQRRIQQSIEAARANATVTTSGAARLLDLGEQQLRDWEKRGLISTMRPTLTGKQTQGHRQFSLDELDRLAVLKELTTVGKFTPGDIENISDTIAEIWQSVAEMEPEGSSTEQQQLATASELLPIDIRLKQSREQLFWRFYVSRVLHLMLLLIGEDRPASRIALVLPLAPDAQNVPVSHIDQLDWLGESLIGRLGESQSTQTLLVPVPSFEFPSDFRIHPLMVLDQDAAREERPLDHTHILVRRDSKPLTLSVEAVRLMRALLRPIYERAEQTRACFGPGLHDEFVPAPHLNNSARYPDHILNGLADMIVALGGPWHVDQHPRWRFCCLLLPDDLSLPLQQRTLVVRAQSQRSPHQVGLASVPPNMNSLSLHAYQSGQVCFRDRILPDDSVIAFHSIEGPIRSAIALPVGAENGEPVAVIYLVSAYEEAFSQKADRTLLRLLGKMVEETISTYQMRLQETAKLRSVLRRPDVVDEAVGMFFAENAFIAELESFLKKFRADHAQQQDGTLTVTSSAETRVEGEVTQPEPHIISIIGVDVDNLTRLALTYGDTAVRNLCREIGLRLKGELKSTFAKYPGCHFYRIYADCFYVLLKDMPYDQVLKKAVLLKKSLDGAYKIDLLRTSSTQTSAADTLVGLDNITVRLAVSAYDDQTLTELFARYPDEIAIDSVREMIDGSIVTELKKGMQEGGDIIRVWKPKLRSFERLQEEEA